MDSENKKLIMGMAIGGLTIAGLSFAVNKIWGHSNNQEEAIEQEATGDVKKILVCGSGMMVPGLVSYLYKRKNNQITIASNIIEDAKAIAKQYPGRTSACLLDVNDLEATTELVKDHDIVISFVPPFLHPKIFQASLNAKRNLVTASYISEEMKGFDEDCKKAGILFLNECGLDPGIDIMSTMKVKDEVEAEGGKIIKYESWCGGLPSAEDADNPLSYKFSWDPKAVFNTSKNSATFLKDGEVVTVEGENLMNTGTRTKNYSPTLNLEGYPNRDSLVFKDAFDFKHAKTFVRGTLRYGGFGIIMQSLHRIGFTDSTIEIDRTKVNSMRDLAEYFVQDIQPNVDRFKDVFEVKHLGSKEDEELASKLLQKADDDQNAIGILTALQYFQLFNKDKKFEEHWKSPLDALSAISLTKMSYEAGERDLVVMRHIFDIEKPDGKVKTLHSTMIATGDRVGETGGFSIMSKTVGYTAAIAVNMILDGKIKATGVWSPKTKEFYEPILAELEKEGIKVVEEYQ